MAGTAEKMLEYMLETRLTDNKSEDPSGIITIVLNNGFINH
jgi:hypothetical protein